MILRQFFEPLATWFARHVMHDDASFDYPAPKAPALQTVMHKRLIAPLNQKNVGSCTGNAMAGCLSTAPFGNMFTEADALSLYAQATHLDSIRGVYPPTDTGSSGLAVAKAAKRRGLIKGYSHAFGLDHALHSLMLTPCITGISWLSGCDEPDAEGIVRYSGTLRGGHEVELTGWDNERGLVWLVNSWGEDWGLRGYFAMPAEDYGKALADHGDVTVPLPTHGVAA